MKILLAGAFGNLGSDILRELYRTEHDIIAADAVIRIPGDLDASRFTAKRELTEKPASRSNTLVLRL